MWAKARDLVLGRARVLGEGQRYEEAVQVLDTAGDWCSDAELVSGMRSLTDRGIVAGNAGRWPPAVEDLRRACRLAPDYLLRRAKSGGGAGPPRRHGLDGDRAGRSAV